MHLHTLTPFLALLTTTHAALMLGTSGDTGTTYTWLRGKTPCTGTPLDPICGTSFTVPGGGANFDYQGCNNKVPYNLPAYNDRNGNRDATCSLLSEGTHSCGGSIGVMTTYAICDSANGS